MELLSHLLLGFETALSLTNLAYCFVGVVLGTAIGVLPGLGPLATISILLPITFGLPPISSLIMLAGIYYGAQYGGSTTAILVNLPGESASVVTVLDGYQMARQGRAGTALATAAIGSFFAGTVATVVIVLFAPPLTEIALRFGPADYFSLMVLGLVASIVLARGSLLHALGMVVLGLALGIVGTDVNSGVTRFTFGFPEMADGGRDPERRRTGQLPAARPGHCTHGRRASHLALALPRTVRLRRSSRGHHAGEECGRGPGLRGRRR